MANKTTKRKPRERRSWLRGQIISSDFFERHWLPIVVIIAIIMTYITGKYICQTRMERINELTHELEVVKAERVRARSEYMGRTCESSMRELVDSILPGLQVQEKPPYVIKTK